MIDERFPGIDLSNSLHPLLGGWRDIREDAARLLTSLDALPQHCECRAGGDVCPCCATHPRPFSGQCRSCAGGIRSLADRINQVLDDTLRFLPAVAALAHGRADGIEAQITGVGWRVVGLSRTLDALAVASGQFAHGCSMEYVAALRDTVGGIAHDVRELEDRLESLRPNRAPGASGGN